MPIALSTKIIKITLPTTVALIVSASLTFPASASPTSPIHQHCFSQASTALEKALCEIKQRNSASNLPSMEQFKKNPPKTQWLLLKREAKKYGIALSKPTSTPAVSKKKPQKNQNTKAHQTQRATNRQTQTPLQNCALLSQEIRCERNLYRLLSNLKYNELKAEALSLHNQLTLPYKSNEEFEQLSDYAYLSQIYPVYIYKMLELGLGDSTMSFTKFATVYWQSKKEKTDFVKRFHFMYNQLKNERSQNSIQRRYQKNFPEDIQLCTPLDSKIIICDNKVQNWIYKKI